MGVDVDVKKEIKKAVYQHRKRVLLYRFESGLLEKLNEEFKKYVHYLETGEFCTRISGEMFSGFDTDNLASKRRWLENESVAFEKLADAYRRFIDKNKKNDELRFELYGELQDDLDFLAEKRKIREKMRELVFDLLDTIQNAK